MQDALNGLLESLCKWHEGVESAVSFRYHDALLALVSYRTEEHAAESLEELERSIGGVGVIYYGIGDSVPLGEADISIRQATTLLAEAHVRDIRRMEWTDLAFDAFSYSAMANPMFARTALSFRRRIEAYDRENDTELVVTARAFVRSFGDITTAANVLHQHPNTVRYRLRRVKALLDMGEATDRELVMFLMLVFIV